MSLLLLPAPLLLLVLLLHLRSPPLPRPGTPRCLVALKRIQWLMSASQTLLLVQSLLGTVVLRECRLVLKLRKS